MTTRRRAPLRAIVLAAACCAAQPSAQGPITDTLLVDLQSDGTTTGPRSSGPQWLTQDGLRFGWFSAETPDRGRELWVTDGTVAGTRAVDDLGTGTIPGVRSATLLPRGILLIDTRSDRFGREPHALVRGSTTPFLLGDLTPGRDGSVLGNFAVLGNTGYFARVGGLLQIEIWRTQGDAASTVVDERLTGALLPTLHTRLGKLWMHESASFTAPVWIKDGTATASRRLLVNGAPLQVAAVGGEVAGRVLLFADDGVSGLEPWISDGTDAGTRLLFDIRPGSSASFPGQLTVDPSGQRIWFHAADGNHGRELWVTDGSAAGTRMVADVQPGPRDGIPQLAQGVAAFGGLVFGATDGTTPTRPWFSDGTAAGTHELVPTSPLEVPNRADSFVAHAGRVWFRATSPTHGTELFETDGTSAGTRLALDLAPGTAGAANRPIGSLPRGLVLAADDATTGVEPWVFDPATRQATLLGNLAPDPRSGDSRPEAGLLHDDFLVFAAVGTAGGFEPFVTDGTPAGTVSLGLGNGSTAGGFTPLAGIPEGLLFQYRPAAGPLDLFVTDGTASGTHRIASLPAPGAPLGAVVTDDGTAWFRVGDNLAGQIWRSDGTQAGTGPVTALTQHSAFVAEAAFGNLIVGRNTDAAGGQEPWVSDGTVAGTRRLADISMGTGSSGPVRFTTFERGVLFVAESPITGREPWFTDGTPAGTRILDLEPALGPGSQPDLLTAFGDRVLLVASTNAHPSGLWSTDGTVFNTVNLYSTGAGPDDLQPRELAVSGDRAFFLVSDSSLEAAELWVTDGTPAGTRRVLASSFTGPRFDARQELVALGSQGRIVFEVWSPLHGAELWTSDGTTAGTRVIADAWTGPASSDPEPVALVGDRMVFTADDGVTGRELHAVPCTAASIGLAEPLGRGCGAQLRANAEPRLGSPLNLTVRSAPSSPAGFVFGIDPAFRSPTPDCEINVVNPMALGLFTTANSGSTAIPLSVPNDPALRGARFVLQAVVATAGGALFGGAETTEGLLVVVGG